MGRDGSGTARRARGSTAMWQRGRLMTRLRARPIAFGLAAVLLGAACSGGAASTPAATRPRRGASTSSTMTSTPAKEALSAPLVWRSCAAGDCATLRVPLDWARPAGEQIELALSRVRAGKPAQRIGSLLVNPGGPGAPGVEFAPQVANILPRSITDRFDIVGWDPRGTGKSTAVDCGAHLDYLFAVDTAPDNPQELVALQSASRRFAQDCATRSPALLPHIASIDTVHDMDRIRAALGDPKLTYAGFSYGTYLGALYAQTYPEHVRAVILDGAIDPSLPAADVSIQQAKGFDQSLQAFFEYCARHTSCPFHHGGDPRSAYEALRARVDRAPLRRGSRTLGPTQLDLGVAAPLYLGRGAYATLATALRAAEGGDPAALLGQADDFIGRRADGTYDAEWPAFLATSCLDGPVLDAASTATLQARAALEAPDFGAANVGLGYACSYWSVPPVNREPTRVVAPSAPPLVVIGTTGDPATPLAWADGLARQLGPATLVTVDGTTHTALLDGGACLEGMATRYLVDLVPPAPGLRCSI